MPIYRAVWRAAQGGSVDQPGGNGRQRGLGGDAQFVVEQLSDDEFSGTRAEFCSLQVERGAVSIRAEDIQADEAMSFREPRTAGLHPGNGFRRVPDDNVRIVFPEPCFEA